MNIFWLDRDVRKSAAYACDQHIVKMITEHTQQLCTALHTLGFRRLPMRPTHKNHPCVLWVGQDFANFVYLVELNHAYYDEYCNRYGAKEHKGYGKMLHMLSLFNMRVIRLAYKAAGLDARKQLTLSELRERPAFWIIPPPQAMPKELQSWPRGNRHAQIIATVEAYRRFYTTSKRKFARYRHSDIPEFMRSKCSKQRSTSARTAIAVPLKSAKSRQRTNSISRTTM